MKLYNSVSKKQENYKPIKQGTATLYSCGPTVYDNLHIGNLSAFIYADILRRSLTVNDYKVNHVMNITDVDDKTIRDSKEQYPDLEPKIALKKLTDKYTKVFLDDITATGVDVGQMTFISAVDSIPEMIQLTQTLLNNKIAYIADDGVYFSIQEYRKAGNTYGILQKIVAQDSKARISNDEYDKDNVGDFALWKRSSEGEPAWDAVFSEDSTTIDMPGRPGWHIECSAMSEKTLGLPFDIHTGGIDLKFPHHENEIAQSIGAGAENFVNYFMHNGHIMVDGKKMSKSLKNFYTLRDIEKKGFDAQAFRLVVLESHYRSESNFSWDILKAAQNRLKNWQAIVDTATQLPQSNDLDFLNKIKAALADDLNTPVALKEIEAYFDILTSHNMSPSQEALDGIQASLGIMLTPTHITEEQQQMLHDRKKARDNKDWQTSDEIRDQLLEQGIRIKDKADQQIWSCS